MLDKFVGNKQIKEILRRMISKNRVPHSLLFAGEEGVGKKHFALEIAKSFVCQNPINFEACDKCNACIRAEKFTFPKAEDKKEDFQQVFFSDHPDVGMVIPYKNNILVDAVRDLEKEANFRPYQAKARIFIIDNADKLNTAKDNAANALLKTLEEPPETTYIFLISSRPDSLLSTILSRCQVLRFAPIKAQEIETKLLKTKKFAPIDAPLIAKLARGSIGRALKTDLTKQQEIRGNVIKILECLLLKKDRAFLLKAAEELNDAKNKENYEYFLDILQITIHDIWAIKLGSLEITNADIFNQLKHFAEKSDSKQLSAWLKEIETLRENFAVNLNKKIATDALFMQMAG